MYISSTTPVIPKPAESTNSSGSASNGLPDSQSLNNMFVQLLVAQLQNQDPLDPLDPSQFVGQLAQFSELSEVTSIYQILQENLPSGSTSSNPQTSPAARAYAAAQSLVPPNINARSSVPASPALPGVPVPVVPTILNSMQGVF